MAATSDEEEVTKFVRLDPPSHYSLRIEAFSNLLSEVKFVEGYRSRDFVVEGYAWNLLLKPSERHDHISLYLAIANPNTLPKGWEVKAVFRFFVFDKLRDSYLTIGDPAGKVRRFHGSNTMCGFSQLMSFKTFEDPANGFLVGDACEFGLEIHVVQPTSDIESLSLKKSATKQRPLTLNWFKHQWKHSVNDGVALETQITADRCRTPSITASNEEEVAQLALSVRQDPPSHYSFKVQSFSLLSQLSINELKSKNFVVGGYKWNLLLKPNEGHDHISLYLAIADPSSLPHGWQVKVLFRFLVFDKIRKNYSTIEDSAGRVRRFHGSNTMWGFSHLMPLETFENPANGFLVGDACEFGVDIFIVHRTSHIDSLSLQRIKFKHQWEIKKFSEKGTCIMSDVFNAGGYEWKLGLYPTDSENRLSLYLYLDSPRSPSMDVYAAYTFILTSPRKGNQIRVTGTVWFKHLINGRVIGGGTRCLVKLDEFKESYLVNDEVTIETEITASGHLTRSKIEVELEAEGRKLTCPICLDKMKQATSTKCGHVFCQPCITSAIFIQKKCPTCRKKLSRSDTHPLYIP